MKKYLHLLVLVFLTIVQAAYSDAGKIFAESAVNDTLIWKWEVSSTVSTHTKSCSFVFVDSLFVDWGDGVREWLPDSLSTKTLTHVYATQSIPVCSAIGAKISYFKADSRRVTYLDTHAAPNLSYISCTSSQLTFLDLSNNPELISLYCASNALTTLDLSHNVKIQTLTCSDNLLTNLDLSAVSDLKKLTCHTNPLVQLKIPTSGNLTYLSCINCSMSVEALDSIFSALPVLTTLPTSKNLYILNNPGTDNCHPEIAVSKNWLTDKLITKSAFSIPSVSYRSGDSVLVEVFLNNPSPAMAFELDLILPDGFVLDTLRSCITNARKGGHTLSVAKISGQALQYKFLAFSLLNKDFFKGSSGSLLQLYMKVPAVEKTYSVTIKSAVLIDTATNVMDASVMDGQLTVTSALMRGDANNDKQVDVTDIVHLVAFINGRNPLGFNAVAVDMDANGFWNIADITKLVVLINAKKTISQSNFDTRVLTSSTDNLRLYDVATAPLGNNFFIRQSESDSTSLELCLDNMDSIQAFQVDVLLPDGIALNTEQVSQNANRNSGHLFSVSKISDAENRYRLLSYSLRPQSKITGNTGVIACLPFTLRKGLPLAMYPIIMEKPVLTGMDMVAVNSLTYDSRITVGSPKALIAPVTVGSSEASGLWVRGVGLRTITILDISGRVLLQQDLQGADFYSAKLDAGVYLVRVFTDSLASCVKKVIVK